MPVDDCTLYHAPRAARPLAPFTLVCLLAAAPGWASDASPPAASARAADSFYREGLKDVDLSGLGEAERERALAILNGNPCVCGCRYTLASCRVQDSECVRSRELAPEVVRRIRAGESDEQVLAYLRSQPIMPRPHPGVTSSSPPASPSPDPGPSPAAATAAPVLEERAYDIPTRGAPVRNPPQAPVTIVEFADFQCGFCAQSLPLLERVLSEYPGQVRLVFKHFPLDSHPQARDAALAALAAQAQDQFWPMHDRLFDSRDRLDRQGLGQIAGELGLDLERFRRDMDGDALRNRLEEDIRDGRAAEVSGTPMFYVNGRKMRVRSLAAFEQAIGQALHAPSR